MIKKSLRSLYNSGFHLELDVEAKEVVQPCPPCFLRCSFTQELVPSEYLITAGRIPVLLSYIH